MQTNGSMNEGGDIECDEDPELIAERFMEIIPPEASNMFYDIIQNPDLDDTERYANMDAIASNLEQRFQYLYIVFKDYYKNNHEIPYTRHLIKKVVKSASQPAPASSSTFKPYEVILRRESEPANLDGKITFIPVIRSPTNNIKRSVLSNVDFTDVNLENESTPSSSRFNANRQIPVNNYMHSRFEEAPEIPEIPFDESILLRPESLSMDESRRMLPSTSRLRNSSDREYDSPSTPEKNTSVYLKKTPIVEELPPS